MYFFAEKKFTVAGRVPSFFKPIKNITAVVGCATNLKNISFFLKCCTKDGGRSSAIGMQMQIANCPKGAVLKRYGTERLGKRAH